MEKIREGKPDLADLIRQNKKRTLDEKADKNDRDQKSVTIPPPTKFPKRENSSGGNSPCDLPSSPKIDQSPKSEDALQSSDGVTGMTDFEKRLLIAAKGSISNLQDIEPTVSSLVKKDDVQQPGFSNVGLFPPFFGFGPLQQMMPFVPPSQGQVFGPPVAGVGRDSHKSLQADENQKKRGKWCSMHVKLAWEIYHNDQYKKDRKKMKMMALAARKKRKLAENGNSGCDDVSKTKEEDHEKEKKVEDAASTSSTESHSQTSATEGARPVSSASIPSKDNSGRPEVHSNSKSKPRMAESTSESDHRRNRQLQQAAFSIDHHFHNPQAAQDLYVKSMLMNQFLQHQNQNRQFFMEQQQRLLYQQNPFDQFPAASYAPPLLQNQADQRQSDLIAASLLFQQMPQGFYGFRQQQTAPFFPS